MYIRVSTVIYHCIIVAKIYNKEFYKYDRTEKNEYKKIIYPRLLILLCKRV